MEIRQAGLLAHMIENIPPGLRDDNAMALVRRRTSFNSVEGIFQLFETKREE
jgi:hypothetical protein